MFIHYRTQGFIIKVADQAEADQLFTLYTKDFGKIEVLGKSIRKIKSKLRGGMQLFYLSEIEFIQGKNYKTLTDALLINNFFKIRHSLEKIEVAERILVVLDSLIKGQEADQEIWKLLNETLILLDEWKLKLEKNKLFYYYFFWNFISVLGYQPELKSLSIDIDTFKILRIILKKDAKTLLKLKLDLSHLESLEVISQKYFNYLLNKIT